MEQLNKNLSFYKIMNYPVPTKSNLFLFEEKVKNIKKIGSEFSWNKKNPLMDKYIKTINKYGKLYKSLPFIKEIYLCNSITFNALKWNSDIDLFIVTKKKHIRKARFFSVLFFKALSIKRGLKNKKQKFCLSFYITEQNKNLYPILIEKTDIYLSYRLGHLVPLYKENNNNTNIYKENKRFNVMLPNHPKEYCINIGNKLFIGNNKLKKILERFFGGTIGKFLENFIKLIRIPILNKKIIKLGNKGRQIIINDKMLKFHDDIRKEVALLYKLSKKK